jgi:hypothetical protein
MIPLLLIIGGCLLAFGILVWIDRLHVPPGYDEACSRIDRELDERGL